MWLLPQLVLVASLCSYTNEDILITQLVPSITKKKGKTAFLECQIKTGAFKKNVNIHWYQQRPGQPLKRILYISSNENVVHEQGVTEEKYEARRPQRDLPASLRIHKVDEADAGLYYCACWDNSGWIKIFAEGTKLIVTPPELTPINSRKGSLKDENDPLPLQLMNTSAYYTYVLLLVKSVVYSIIIAYCLLGRGVLCSNGKSSE